MSSLIGGVLLTFLVGPVGQRLTGVVVFSAGAGLLTAAIVQRVLSVIPGPYAAVAGVLALTTFAVCGAVTGLGAALGRAGISVGAVTMMLVANPLSGITSAPEMLPRPWGTVGQDLPAGAGATLLRSVAFFGGARSAGPLTALLSWSAGGLLLLAVAGLWSRRRPPRRPDRGSRGPGAVTGRSPGTRMPISESGSVSMCPCPPLNDRPARSGPVRRC